MQGQWKGIRCACIVVFVAGWVFAQESSRTIKMQVRDQNTRHFLEAVEISVPGTSLGTVSDHAGHFALNVPGRLGDVKVLIQHIAYEPVTMQLSQLQRLSMVELVPRVIPLQGVKVEADGIQAKLSNDLPQAINIIESRVFQNKGYLDAADMLKTDHSIQVSESHTGKRQVSLRGGNPDETMILYNNIRMNRVYDSRFDLSLIDIDEMARLEVIKGSNSILYGTGALAGVINIIPKYKKNYTFGFKQNIGSYDAGSWALQAYRAVGPFDLSYTFKKGATHRVYENMSSNKNWLINEAVHHQANMAIHFDKKGVNELFISALSTDFDYDNERLSEALAMKSRLIMAHFIGRLPFMGSMEWTTAYTTQEENQSYAEIAYIPQRKMESQSFQWNFEKILQWRRFETIVSYQYERDKMEYSEVQRWSSAVGVEVPYDLQRNHHGAAFVGKYHAPSGFEILSTMDFDLSIRRDWVSDRRFDSPDIVETNWAPSWPTNQNHDVTTAKFSAHISGMREDLVFNAYMNYGTSVKFPSLTQQVSRPQLTTASAEASCLDPEENNSMELGADITRQVKKNSLVGWQLTGNFFKNFYNNKFRYFFVPGIPVAYYDNVRTASISGIEVSGKVFLFNKKLTLGGGVSKYSVSDKAAFPFKYDAKFVADCVVEHQGWQAHVHFFAEGSQVGWVRFAGGGFGEVEMPGFVNFDIFLGKSLKVLVVKGSVGASVRNLLDTELVVAELPYRDRQYNVTLNINY